MSTFGLDQELENREKALHYNSSDDEKPTQILSKNTESECLENQIKQNLQISAEQSTIMSLNKIVEMIAQMNIKLEQMNNKMEQTSINFKKDLNELKAELKGDLHELKWDLHELKAKLDKLNIDVKHVNTLVDYQFEITARWKIGKDYGLNFSNLYKFKNF